MRHVNYQRWAYYLSDLFLKADIQVNDVLDISCGTGNLLIKLTNLKFKVAGFDESEKMVKLTQFKARNKGMQIPVWQGSMLQFEVKKLFHALICTYDSINYCMDLETCLSTIHHSSKALEKGGVFVFDICTEKNSRNNFQQYYEKDQTDDFQYVRQSSFSLQKKIQINEFHIMWNSNSAAVYKEKHLQRIYRIDEIKSIIPLDCFQIVGVYDGFSMRAGSEKSDRVHFVLKKI